MNYHKFSSNNRDALENTTVCGCFHCLKIFDPVLITEWIDEDDTAVCPFCGVDSIVSRNINEQFLKKMKNYWFNE